MRRFYLSIMLGALAGIIDVLPMILQKLDMFSTISAFTQWMVASVIINYIDFPIRSWLKGLIVAEALAVPIMVLVMKAGFFTILPIMIMCAILGSIVGIISGKFEKQAL